MIFHEQSEDYRPLFWMSGRPIYATTLLLILHVAAFVITALCMSFLGGAQVLEAICLYPYQVIYRGEVWRLFSYVIFPPSLWFVFAMGFLFFAGREVEQFVGRKIFLKLYAALILIPAVVLCVAGFVWPMQHLGGTESIFGLFVAFATLYPGFVLNIWFVNLTAKGWAYVLLGVYSLIDLAAHDWPSLLVLWSCAGIGYAGMRLIGAGHGLTWLTDWLENRQAKRLASQRNFKVLKEAKATQSIDEILEKISKQGVGSLDAKERAALERARTNLLKRDQS
jgi:membrane associated rhomboid family serine protease